MVCPWEPRANVKPLWDPKRVCCPAISISIEYTGCFTGAGTKENDISQYTIWQMKADEFHFMLIRRIITYKIWIFKKEYP